MAKNESVIIERSFSVQLTLDEALQVVAKLVQEPKNKKAVEILLANAGRFGCPFPNCCNYFPCADLYCRSDECDNGYPFRRS